MFVVDKTKFANYAQLRWSNYNTRYNYLTLSRRIEKYWDGDQITQETIDGFLREISELPSYGNSKHRAFLKAYIDCYQDDIDDAGIKIKLIKHTSRQRKKLGYKFLEREQVNELLRKMQDPQMKIISRLFFETGLRLSELTSIRSEDIDFGLREMRGIGKGNREFLVRFSPRSLDWLVSWYDKCPLPERPFAMYKKDGGVCKNQGCALRRKLDRELKRAGLGHMTPHQLRHSLGHFLRAELGLDLVQIKTKLRHESITSTQIYAPATAAEVDGVIDEKMFKIKPEAKP